MTTIESTLLGSARNLSAASAAGATIWPAESRVYKKAERVYSAEVSVSEPVKAYLLACCRNHLVIYNDVLNIYRKNRTLTYKELKAKLNDILANTSFTPVIHSVIHAEIYYMSKKSDFKQKLLTSIQYITTFSWGYRGNKVFRYQASEGRLWVGNAPEAIVLTSPLPPADASQSVYINLSYSTTSDSFELSVFSSPL